MLLLKRLLAFRDLSLRNKLIWISMLSTGLALLFASVVFISAELISLRRSLMSNAEGFAQTIALNVKADLAFNDQVNAEETLKTLRAVPNIVMAIIYDARGNVFATYGKTWQVAASRNDTGKLSVPRQGISQWIGNRIAVYRNIDLDGESVGAVYIESDTKEFRSRAIRYLITLVAIMILSLLFSYLLYSKLHTKMTRPLNELAQLMHSVSENKKYWLRAEAGGRDEIGALAQGFNEMLANIEARDEELLSYRKHLEELVDKRTAELRGANRQLQHQLEERSRMENALMESEHRYRTIFETTGTASMIVHADAMISLVNNGFEKLSGFARNEVEGKRRWTEFFQDDPASDMIRSCLSNGALMNGGSSRETFFFDSQGAQHDVYLSLARIPGSPTAVASILDLTELKQLEVQLLHAQKMEAIGQLAGGIAHDFNNILSAIIGYGSLLKERLAEDDPTFKEVSIILSSAERAAQLTSGLLAFSRKQVMSAQGIDLNEAIRKLERLLAGLLTEDIDLKIDYCGTQLPVFGDQGKIEQVLMNLVANARDAMTGGGTLTIKTGLVRLPEDAGDRQVNLAPGSYARISVSDTGCGMSKETIDRIFEPFYTTKEVGKGTGLGLSIVYGVIDQHGGKIDVASVLGTGTTFHLYFPVTSMSIEGEASTAVQSVTGGDETIMIVEDDIVTRTLTVEILTRYGYTVVEAVDGDDAIRKYAELKSDVDLVILDVIMPKKNGKETYEEMKSMNDNIKALFVSGYTADIMEQKGFDSKEINFLSKPIVPKVFAVKVREVLDS